MTEPELLVLRGAMDGLRAAGLTLRESGWNPELVVYAPGELTICGRKSGGYAIALIIEVERPVNGQ